MPVGPCSANTFHPSVHLSTRDLFSGEYLLSPWFNIAYTSLTRVPMVKGCAVTLNEVCRSRSYWIGQILFFNSIYTLHLALFCSHFIQTELLRKGCTVTLNQVSRSIVKVIAELYEKTLSRAYLFSLLSNLDHTSLTECLRSKCVQWP